MRRLPPSLVLAAFVAALSLSLAACDTDDAASSASQLSATDLSDTYVSYGTYPVDADSSLDMLYRLIPAGGGEANQDVIYLDNSLQVVLRIRYVVTRTGVQMRAQWPGIDTDEATVLIFDSSEPDAEPTHQTTVQMRDDVDWVRIGLAAVGGRSIHKKPGDIRVDNDNRDASLGWCRAPGIPQTYCFAYGLAFDAPVPFIEHIRILGEPGASFTVFPSSED